MTRRVLEGPHGRRNVIANEGPGLILLRVLVAEKDGKLCERCQCCEMSHEECDNCGGEGVDGHDCGEDCCACLEPEENMTCSTCDGDGSWWLCDCNEHGIHER